MTRIAVHVQVAAFCNGRDSVSEYDRLLPFFSLPHSHKQTLYNMVMLQVAAYCNGRDSVSEYDCLLLEHVLWQSPEHAPKIADWLLAQLAVDDGMKQVRRGW